jgi:peroxiredoxin
MSNGPKVGESAPVFELPDSTGQMQTIQSLTNGEGALLVFFRGLW